jgi:phosphate transport system protein
MQFGNHAFKGFDISVQQLITQLQHMGELVVSQITLLQQGLDSEDKTIHGESKLLDQQINEAEAQTDRLVADILAKYSPAGDELRFLLGAVKVASSMELLADHMKNCSKRLVKVPHPLDVTVRVALEGGITALHEMIPLGLQQLAQYQEATTDTLLTLGMRVQHAYRHTLLILPQLQVDAEHSQHIVLVAKNLDQASDKVLDMMKIAHFIHKGTRYERR